MVGLKLLSLALATIFSVGTNRASAAGSVATANKADRVDCSESMNAARKLVGFADLTLGEEGNEKLPIDPAAKARTETVAAYVKSVCTALKSNEASPPGDLTGTYAYAVQEGTSANCEAAVDYWKAALSNFDGLPPQYTAETKLYKTPQNVSFISLFNPNENPKVDCAYFTCPAQQDEPNEPDGASVREKDSELEGEGESTTDKEVKALLCVTTPNALTTNKAPYTQDQWDQINAGLKKNSAPALPTFLGFAAAAVGVVLF
ncbi:SAG family member [Eimeria mitis]|uniref:SAG family member n=1 Tax=Eimeria mitis TaxID=44415 RepID=U6KG94_9EIME|nr:SAG family member [Eimeria mitis]CDJ34478.1 SAG family member [Eimeria mitis]